MVGVELDSVKDILTLYCRALTGRRVQILSTKDLTDRSIGWAAADKPTTEGSTIFVPPRIADFGSTRQNFDYYKVLVAHQAGHLEFGTFDFRFERPASAFDDCRPFLAKARPVPPSAISDYERFFDLFGERRLAADIFTVVEDTRVDARVRLEYRGIRQPLTEAQLASAAARTSMALLPLREALLEALLLTSLELDVGIAFPAQYLGQLREGAGLLQTMKKPYLTVEDSGEATVRLYSILIGVPNVSTLGMPRIEIGSRELADGPHAGGEREVGRWLERFPAAGEENVISAAAQERRIVHPYRGIVDVRFRGGFKPELVQTLMQLRRTEEAAGQERVSRDALKHLLGKNVEIEAEYRNRWFDSQPTYLVENWLRMQERSRLASIPGKNRTRGRSLSEGRRSLAGAGSVKTDGEGMSFYYDEWDYLTGRYRSTWCHLRQTCLAEGSVGFYEATLQTYSSLLAAIRRQFALLKPEGFKRRRKLQDGEEIDFDAVIEAVIDKKTGWTPSDKLYSRRRKAQRDVSVAFLLDMSASTGERIRESPPSARNSWLAGVSLRPGEKRVIDVEKESLVLLITAVEALGDRYGIYGFSGSGRENVQFFVIKDLEEGLSEKVKRRIDNIVPVQGTRMGPAIRHCISVLDQQDSKTKLLVLLSDGRPQDVDYGQDVGGAPYMYHSYLGAVPVQSIEAEIKEREYAIHDTKMALQEARQRCITPFCLSIDKLGRDYLRQMCGDIGYEVLDDIRSLPRRLPSLYRRLTT